MRISSQSFQIAATGKSGSPSARLRALRLRSAQRAEVEVTLTGVFERPKGVAAVAAGDLAYWDREKFLHLALPRPCHDFRHSSIKIIIKVRKIIIKADSQKTEIETLVDTVEDITNPTRVYCA